MAGEATRTEKIGSNRGVNRRERSEMGERSLCFCQSSLKDGKDGAYYCPLDEVKEQLVQ